MYINKNELTRVITFSELTEMYSNVSFENDVEEYDGWLKVHTLVCPTISELQKLSSRYSIENGKAFEVYDIVDMFSEYTDDEGVLHTKAEQESEYKDKLMQDKIKSVEQAVQSHINAKCVNLGYDNENSIAKYLVEGNQFYEECKALSLWIGNVWVETFSIINEVRPIPTIEEILAELPEL